MKAGEFCEFCKKYGLGNHEIVLDIISYGDQNSAMYDVNEGTIDFDEDTIYLEAIIGEDTCS